MAYAAHTGSSSEISICAALHLTPAIPNFLSYEVMQSDWSKDQRNPLRWDHRELPIRAFRDGHIDVEDKPGLRIEIDENVVDRHRV